MADRKVTVQVDINAAGNLKQNLQDIQRSIGQIENIPGKTLGQISKQVFTPQIQQTAQQIQMGAIASKIIGSPDHIRFLRIQAEAAQQQVRLQQQMQHAQNIANPPGFGAQMSSLMAGLRSVWGLGLATAGSLAFAARSASPDAFATLNQSIVLLAGTIGGLLVPQMVELSRALQRGAGLAGQGLRQAEPAISMARRIGAPFDPIANLNRFLGAVDALVNGPNAANARGVLVGMANFKPQQIPIENLHDVIQQEAVRAPLDQATFDMQRQNFDRMIEQLSEQGPIAEAIRRAAERQVGLH